MAEENNELTAALLDQVTASLPNMVGTQLRKRLEQADRDATAVSRIEKLDTEIAALRNQVIDLSRASVEVKAREAAVLVKERALEIKTAVLEEREKNMTQISAYPLLVLDKIFRERSLMSNLNLSGSLGNGGYINLVGGTSKTD